MISKNKVPHSGPLSSPIFILGEAPSSDDDYLKEPFTGRAGDFLSHCLELAGIDRSLCRLGNVCNYRPDKGDFHLLRGTKQLDEGYKELNRSLSDQRPRVIIALGNEALNYLKGHAGISNWRGSVLPYQHNSYIIPTYHPGVALRDGTLAPQVIFDLQRAAKILKDGYTPPIHDFIIDPDEPTFNKLLEEVKQSEFVACDIESIRDTQHILCFGVALSDKRAFCIKNHYGLNSGLEEHFRHRVEQIIDSAKGIVYHNGGFDCEMLRLNGIESYSKFKYDTMLAQRVLEPELPIGLDFCASIYTDEPYYKGDGKETGKRIPQTLWEYNCKDCIVTFKTRDEQQKVFDSDRTLKNDRDFIFSRIPLMQEFQRNGMLVDEERRSVLKIATQSKLEISAKVIEIASSYTLNFRSPKQVKELLYDILKLPQRTNRDGELTTDENALVSLMQFCQEKVDSSKKQETKDSWMLKIHTLKSLLEIRGNEKLISSYFDATISTDSRIRSSYYPAGTDTGRWSCSTYVDGSGLNAQTLPRGKVEVTIEN